MKPIEQYFESYPLLHGFKKNWEWIKDVNHSNPFYSPFYYLICRGLKAKNILEVGPEDGYSSYMLAKAAKENEGTYYCIEKAEGYAKQIKMGCEKEGFPHLIIWADSKDIKDFEWAEHLDFVLMDGEHSREAIEHEFEIFYPKLTGYIALHDIESVSADGFWSIINNPKYDLEYITFPYNFGLALFRKREVDIDERRKKFAEVTRKTNINFKWIRGGRKPQDPGKITIL